MTKTKPLIQIDDEIREMTDDEFGQHQANQQLEVNRKAELESKSAAKSALLERLGMKEDEIALLFQ